jgi:hypothetical protein
VPAYQYRALGLQPHSTPGQGWELLRGGPLEQPPAVRRLAPAPNRMCDDPATQLGRPVAASGAT